tara:strand:- start:176 stop:616 length:441 start_codon:yes stop_codon:yes gene_type:complete
MILKISLNQLFILNMNNAVWKSNPSQLTNIKVYLFLFWTVIIPLIVYLKTRFTIYELTDQIYREKTGILSQKIEELELYRVRDYSVDKPFLMRLFGLGNLTLITSDKTNPRVYMRAIRNVENVRDIFRKHVEEARKATGTKEVDFT